MATSQLNSHQVDILFSSDPICAGTLISSCLVLTVFSCLKGKNETKLKVRASQKDAAGNQQIVNADLVYSFPASNSTKYDSDIAVILLEADFKLGKSLRAINIIEEDLDEAEAFIPLSQVTSSSSYFENCPVERVEKFECNRTTDNPNSICVKPSDQSSCPLSVPVPLIGSGLVCQVDGPYFLCGALAGNGENANEYTDISKYLHWIRPTFDVYLNMAEEEGELELENWDLDDNNATTYLAATVAGGANATSPIPYQLSIQYKTNDHSYHICGAVILDKRTVITAAHCFDKPKKLPRLIVVSGTTDLNDTRERVRVWKIVIHPDYKDFRNGSDIAILHVDRMYFHQDVQPIWLPRFSTEKLSNMTAVISGWGQVSDNVSLPNTLQMGKISIIPKKDCLYQLQHRMRNISVRTGVVCGLGEVTRTCAGDSGGPLVIQNYRLGNSVGNLLVGITSFGPATCSLLNATGVFTEVSHFYQWIQENRAKKPCDGEENMLPCMTSTKDCYHKDWECDNHRDCPDGTDELNCPEAIKTPRDNLTLYATLNLAHSVIKHESFDLQVKVHNNLGHDVNVWVTIFNRHNRFGFLDSRGKRNGNETRYIKADKNNATLVHFAITPLVAGHIPIEVKVFHEDGTEADLWIQSLKVKPDGGRQSRRQLFVFRKIKNYVPNQTREKSFDVKFPEKVVKGENSVQLTVIGDPMWIIVSNLYHFFDLPTTNGEQNLMKLVPNVLALDYLNATNSYAKNIPQQAKTYLQRSYAHQLLYRNSDGSFSVHQSEKGSTWLTSHALRWFAAAQKYITIDQEVIKGAVNFTLSRQNPDGSFLETGPFDHPRLGGHNGANGVALTAYITLALIKAHETLNNDLDLKVAIENGMRFISKEAVYQLDDNYITNLVAATLTAGNHPEKTRFFKKMEKRAKSATTKQVLKLKFWDTINKRQRANGPLAIEMTSYALLAHLWQEGKKDSSIFYIYNWLLSQQNPQGGFKSTQDTVMGLTALTEFALRTKGIIRDEDELYLNIRASLNSSRVNDTEIPATVTRGNRMALQEFKLPVSTKVVGVHARGSGAALIQMTESWHTPINKRARETSKKYFNIAAEMTIPDPAYPDEADLEVCISSVDPRGFNRSTVASIELPSGYTFYPSDFEEGSFFRRSLTKNIRRFEVAEGDTKVDVYYSSIPHNPPTCLAPVASRRIQVANTRNASVLVYETADPDVQGIVSYFPAHKINACQLCQVTNCDVEGCQNRK